MFRFNPFHAFRLLIARIVTVWAPSVTPTTSRMRWLRRIVALALVLSAVPATAQEVVVIINMNSCWNACSSEASRTYNDWVEIQGASHDDAMAEALAHLEECMEGCEGPY